MQSMSFQVTLNPSGNTFNVNADETVLEAAMRQGIGLPYGCRNGACGSCKAKITAGSVDIGNVQERSLRAEEQANGMALLCCAKPREDLTITVKEIGGAGDIQVRTLPCRVETVEKPATDVAILYLKLPAQERLQFMAGQYVDVLLKDGKRRSYSMANAPHDDTHVQLHIRHVPDGVFSGYVFNDMRDRAILRFEGPLGSFFLREDSNKPVLLMAGGTGFAPIKAILEHAFHKHIDREFVLYWGARSLADLYMAALPAQWAQEYPNFSFIPVLSEPLASDNWPGRTGFVHQAIADDFKDLSGYQVYACGAPPMIDAGRAAFTAQGLPEDEFFADSFTYAAAVSTTTTTT
jgi:CDP-4-dehydro-6-deoxyglucose reductase, E3